ncbi:hypothetical protein N9Q25_00495 [bacterium]|jgi:hypothetical protein|nr:hypothetical protein [bacterium]
MKSDYLKYYRVVRQFIKKKYKLTQAELDVLLFLRSEEYFSKDKFNEFDELLSWDVNRFDKLRRDKWIEVFRKRMGNRKALYMLSNKAKRVVNSIYKKLNGEEIPTSNDGNPMFLQKVSYTDKVYRNFIKEMNAFTRQQRHQTPK